MSTTLVLPCQVPLAQSGGSPVDELELVPSELELEVESVVVEVVLGSKVVGALVLVEASLELEVSRPVVVLGSSTPPVEPSPLAKLMSDRPQPMQTSEIIALARCRPASIPVNHTRLGGERSANHHKSGGGDPI